MIDQAAIGMAIGNQIAVQRISGVNDNMTQSHYHEYFELYYLESGQRYHMAGECVYSIEAGSFILFPPYTMHHSYGEEGISFKRLVLYFSKDIIAVPGFVDMLGSCAHVYQLSNHQDIHALICSLLREQELDDPLSEESQYLMLNILLIMLLRNSAETARPEKETRINKIIHYLQENYTNDITLNKLSDRFYLSPYYLCREFKKHTNSTVIQYINTLRVIHAQKLFLETDDSITDISKTVGFANVTHFNRIYKSITGMSPSESRKQSKERQSRMELEAAQRKLEFPQLQHLSDPGAMRH